MHSSALHAWLPQVVVWDLEAGSKRGSILIDELEHAKNVRYHISKDGTQVTGIFLVG